jgi:hypothetical protein
MPAPVAENEVPTPENEVPVAESEAPAAEYEAPAAENEAEGPGRFRRMTGRFGRVSSRLATGIPVGFVAALASLVLIALLFTVAAREPSKPRAYAELTLVRNGCLIDKTRENNSIGCQPLGPRSFRVTFSRSLKGSTPIASRGSCCPGKIGATVVGEQSVTIAVDKRVKTPIRVSVLVP